MTSWSLPNKFTFDDNSTLTSFADLPQHHNRADAEYYTGNDDNTSLSSSSSLSSSDRQSVSGSRSSCSSNSNSFWATLSAHAASAAITSSASGSRGSSSNPNMAQTAANAAANSLLEDSQAMERINALRLKQKQQHPIGGTKPLMRITHQTVRNSASKASIAVLISSANQDVATAVASAILREGGSMLGKEKRKGQHNKMIDGSVLTKETMSTSSTVVTSQSVLSPKKSLASMKEKKLINACGLINGLHSSSQSSSHSSKSSNYAHHIVESLQEQHYKRIREQCSPDDATVQSISTAKYGKDKYATTDMDSVVAGGSISLGSIVTKETRSVRGAASMNNDIYMNEEVMNAVRAAMAMMEQKDQNSVPTTLSFPAETSLMTQQPLGQEEDPAEATSTKEESLSTDLETMDKAKESRKNSCSLKVLETTASSVPRNETLDDSTIGTESHHKLPQRILVDPSSLDAQNMGRSDSYLATVESSSVAVRNAESIMAGKAKSSPSNNSQQQTLEVLPEGTAIHNVVAAEDQQQPIAQRQQHQCHTPLVEERRKLEQKQANYLAALGVLQKKLNELECRDDGHHSSSSGSGSGSGRMERQPQTQTHRQPPQQYHQLQQLSMIANPSAIRKTSSSMWTPMIANSNTIPMQPNSMIQRAYSSTCTHYPPLPPMGTLMSVGTTHHGYHGGGIVAANTLITSSSASSSSAASTQSSSSAAVIRAPISNHYSTASASSSSAAGTQSSSAAVIRAPISGSSAARNHAAVPRSSSSVRSVLKKPSKCFPIIDTGDDNEMMGHPTWDEHSTVFTPLGECRIHSMTTNDSFQGKEEVSRMFKNSHGMPSTPGTDQEAEVEEKEEAEEVAIEVFLVTESTPRSPTARLRSRFKEFFWQKSKKVMFDMNFDNGDESLQHQPCFVESTQQQNCSAENEMAVNSKNIGGEPGAINSTTTAPSSSMTAKNGSSSATTRRRSSSSPRDSFRKRLRRGRLFKSSSSKKGSNGGGAAATATVVESTSSSTVARGDKNTIHQESISKRKAGNEQCSVSSQGTTEKIDEKEAALNQSPLAPAEPTDMHNESTFETDTRSAFESSNSYLDDISSRYTTSDNDNSNSATTDDEGTITVVTNEELYSHGSSSNSDPLLNSRFAPYKKHSVYIGDVIQLLPAHGSGGDSISDENWVGTVLNRFANRELSGIFLNESLPTYRDDSISDENWVETVLNRFTNGELKGEGGGDNSTTATVRSAKSSLAGFNFV